MRWLEVSGCPFVVFFFLFLPVPITYLIMFSVSFELHKIQFHSAIITLFNYLPDTVNWTSFVWIVAHHAHVISKVLENMVLIYSATASNIAYIHCV